DAIEAQGLQENAARMGERLTARLRALSSRHPLLAAVRGAGLMIGVDIRSGGAPDKAAAARIVNGMREAGVLVSSCGMHHNVLKVRPPLVIDAAGIDLFADALAHVLSTMEGDAR